MSFISRLFKKSKVVDSVFDKKDGHLAKIGAFIGNRSFTEEEQAEMMVGVTRAVREFSIATATQSTERSVLTRDLAVLWIKSQLGLVWVSVISLAFENYEMFDRLWMITSGSLMMGGTFGVMTYFFGAYGWAAHIKSKK